VALIPCLKRIIIINFAFNADLIYSDSETKIIKSLKSKLLIGNFRLSVRIKYFKIDIKQIDKKEEVK
jgi:hypothetical protein